LVLAAGTVFLATLLGATVSSDDQPRDDTVSDASCETNIYGAFRGPSSEHTLLHAQGKVLFPIGFYELPKDDAALKRMADAGVNFVRCGNRADLDRVQAAGMFGWLPLDLSQGATDDLRSQVNSVADHAALAVWEGPDEVVWNFTGASSLYRELGVHKKGGAWKRRDPEAVAYAEEQAKRIIPNMRAAAEMIRGIDKQDRPIWINEARDSDADYVRQYLGYIDITGCDIYPVKASERDVAQVGAAVRRWKEIGGGKAVWMVLQAFSWDELGDYYGAKTTVYPTFAESRFMAYDAIANGAAGILYWGSHYLKSDALRQSIYALASEINRLQPFLVGPDVQGVRTSLKPGGPASDAVKAMVRKADGDSMILLLNEDGNASFDVAVEGLSDLNGKSLYCLYTSETISLQQGRFSAHLGPLETKLYATDRKWESALREGRDFKN
jgi:hypothetical protein